MDPNIKKNENSALIPQYNHKFCSELQESIYIETDIYELLSNFAV